MRALIGASSTTILPPEEKFDELMSKFKRFHAEFMDEFRDSPRARL